MFYIVSFNPPPHAIFFLYTPTFSKKLHHHKCCDRNIYGGSNKTQITPFSDSIPTQNVCATPDRSRYVSPRYTEPLSLFHIQLSKA